MSQAIILFVSLLLISATTQLDSTSNASSKVIIKANETILSENRTFELGFFNTNGEPRWYLGIWYASMPTPTYIWVANRETPAKNLSVAAAVITVEGKLAVIASDGEILWRTENAAAAGEARLLEEGNLVLLGGEGEVVWRSFDFPADTWLPGMNLSGRQSLTCWRSSADPAPGKYSLRLKPQEYGEIELVFNGSHPYWSTGNWTGDAFSGVPEMTIPYIYRFHFSNPFTPAAVFGYTEVSAEEGGRPPLTRFQVDFSGRLRQYTWSPQTESWNMFWSQPENHCKVYGLCGKLGFCNTKMLIPCKCLVNFEPIDGSGWGAGDFSGGCRRRGGSICGGEDVFEEIGAVSFDGAITESFSGTRMILAIMVVALLLFRKRRIKREKEEEDAIFPVTNLKVFSYKELNAATRGFSEKLGHGGFGAVFRGELGDSSPVAVKRLERPGGAEREFRAEVCTIGNIQHVNLVRLRGFCSENSHRLLVYDYMPNGPLSVYLKRDGKDLNWDVRFRIAVGTAKAIAYLHEECRDCIIHCDIKPENILLDEDCSPKVSDFGLAKLVGRDFSRVLATMRGTRGYVAPEWLSGVAITAKADVYSYGMTLLELIGGRRNVEGPPSAGGGGAEEKWFFPPWAAHQIIEGNVAAVVDERLPGGYDIEEAERLGLVAVWCIQDEEATRPTMGMVVKILEGVVEVGVPPPPKLLQALVSGESFHGVGADSGIRESASGCPNDNVQISGNSMDSRNHLPTTA
ncbi:G-type lectin S-receptor-like serine/threonine-protein kinase SD2-2 isoform X1 [Actinidia eriantha]|uniref:G-type lectin S-receptor-like serine/threonine-protein kinase SD2-2 isoform X1 n=1 Tax=Actinidia eriantha TaxID=165200 RepID=UPI00258BF6E8|nr:G-type lectin S-receptor-like serine/threonine-protein kinase SD2-2 isoform X1 [Actinidia eriantha]